MSRRKKGNKSSRGRKKKQPKQGSILSNRRNPESSWVSFYDIGLNIYEKLFGWWHRVPKGSTLYWRDGKIVGHSTRQR